MTPIFLLILSLFSSFFQEEKSLEPAYIFVDGLSIRQQGVTSIFEKYGVTKHSPTDYECGFFSNEEQGTRFFKLNYQQLTWIGNAEGVYFVDMVRFDPAGEMKWSYYKEAEFSGKSSQEEVEHFLEKSAEPIQIKGREEEDLFHLGGQFKNQDDGFYFLFHKGKLIEFHYWSPC
ncbi:hypothetical protein [Algoriphagus vanfongensis]|uniref:hypothetical protein n=1 Tax=Algoriphagus vanfongensis TaxID=426371 RepID=UPI00047CF880|nr:hypothetical protein [Algoriphagus vanfongensis]